MLLTGNQSRLGAIENDERASEQRKCPLHHNVKQITTQLAF
jgi:hypothetical protein